MYKFYTIALLIALGFFSKHPISSHHLAQASFLLVLALAFAGCLYRVVRDLFDEVLTGTLG